MKKGILVLSPFFSPNIGGVETHLDDLVRELNKTNKYKIYVHTYSPITTSGVEWKKHENIGNIYIYRYLWFGKNLFAKLEKYPVLDFLYITPYLFIRTFIWMFFNQKKIKTIHSHGFNGALIGLCLQKIFNKKHIISTHALYKNDPHSLTIRLIKFVLNNVNVVLAQSNTSKNQLISWGVNPQKIDQYRHWLDLNNFKQNSETRKKIREKLKIKPNNFVVVFVGRLIAQKGARLLAKTAITLKDIKFIFIGTGPEEEYLKKISKKYKNIIFIGRVSNKEVADFYNAADIFCSPVLYEEGYSRTIMEGIACGLPVLASNYGTIPEITSPKIAILIKPTLHNLQKQLKILKSHPEKIKQFKKNCLKFAAQNYSIKNLEMITKHY